MYCHNFIANSVQLQREEYTALMLYRVANAKAPDVGKLEEYLDLSDPYPIEEISFVVENAAKNDLIQGNRGRSIFECS
ncbi:predicted protein [Sclerotinia sclerotiorum 1980 UF-70]|uniref:Uncharacterized protein n=1 Tax=Sclerotinia sclerotiorum (strain ATCC 18683 / 1980 / Ss-1) TaxID=665079 RepID=A7EFV4_SCLS1|nr:predicted protein [Sclerotinia sclerotiorum 1980 UF-70]EDO01720.1 predicted protein [Sclerotinia sclerotiorum 1980 UF-70]